MTSVQIGALVFGAVIFAIGLFGWWLDDRKPLRSFAEIYDGMKDTPEFKYEKQILEWSERALLAEELLKRIRQWDMLDACCDGPFWKREIDSILDLRKNNGE